MLHCNRSKVKGVCMELVCKKTHAMVLIALRHKLHQAISVTQTTVWSGVAVLHIPDAVQSFISDLALYLLMQ